MTSLKELQSIANWYHTHPDDPHSTVSLRVRSLEKNHNIFKGIID